MLSIVDEGGRSAFFFNYYCHRPHYQQNGRNTRRCLLLIIRRDPHTLAVIIDVVWRVAILRTDSWQLMVSWWR